MNLDQKIPGRSSHASLGMPATARNYPYNCWWVAARSGEVGRDMLSRWILEMPILFYRREDGTVVAIEDRCPHRGAPLSDGKLQGDNVVCGYHGFEFAPSGRCVRVPTQGNPGRISARSYPVREQYPFIWIYTGDLARIDEVPNPMESLKWGAEPGIMMVNGYTSFHANYMLLQENVLDLTHIPHVHAKTFESDWVEPAQVSVHGDTVLAKGRPEQGPLIPYYAMGSDLPSDKIMNQLVYSTFESPALQTAAAELDDPSPGPDGRTRYTLHFCHITTPIDMQSMHYWWMGGRDYGRTDQEFKDLFASLTSAAFAEDKVVLEAIQHLADRADPRRKPVEFSVAADAGGVEARRALQRWMAREADPSDPAIAAKIAPPVSRIGRP